MNDTHDINDISISILRQKEKILYNLDNPYQGNKRKIIVDISEELEESRILYNSVVDVFSGSAVCSIFFKLMDKSIFCNDLLTSSYYNALAFVVNSKPLLTAEHITFLCTHLNNNKSDFVRREYSNRFTPEEALFLDNYRANVDILANGEELIKAVAIVLIEHYVMRKCFLGGRLNKGQILAELKHRVYRKDKKTDSYDEADLYGHGNASNSSGVMKFNLKPLRVFESTVPCKAYNMDAVAFLNEPFTADLAYLDPPYGGGQSDYAAMFSFCEEYIYSKKISELPHLSNSKKFVSQKDYENNFNTLLSACERFPYWAISYNDSSWANIDVISGIIKDHKNVEKVVRLDYKYNYRKDRKGKEYLIIAN